MPRVIHFEIHADQPSRAVQFYITGVGWLAYCKDTEGNIFGIMQSDPQAH